MADPICTFLFSIFVLGTTFTIMRDILVVLMEGKATARPCLFCSDSLSLVLDFYVYATPSSSPCTQARHQE